MMGMPAQVTIEVVTHVQQFFGNADLDPERERQIDPLQVHQNGVALTPADKAVRPTDSPGYRTPADPPGKGWTVRRNVKIIGREVKQRDVLRKHANNAIVTLLENHR